MIRIKVIISLVLTYLCASCAHEQPVFSAKDLPAKVTLQKFVGGKKATEREVERGSTEFVELSQWIDAHTSGWKSSMVSYAPRIVVRGEYFSINCKR